MDPPCLDFVYECPPLYRVLQVAQASFIMENFAASKIFHQKRSKPERPVILENIIYEWPLRHLWSPPGPLGTLYLKITRLVIYKEPETALFSSNV